MTGSQQQPFTATPLSPAVGSEISGLDLGQPLQAETVSALREIWVDRGLLVFRNNDLSIEDQIRFADYFGTPSETNTRTDPDRDPRILLISNIRENGRPIGALPDGELQFHSDSAFHKEPLMATLLYSVEIPSTGGDTLFANANTAYEKLPKALRDWLDGLTAINGYDYSNQVKRASYDRSSGPNAIHPVIRTHPETGHKAIYVNRLMTEEICDLPDADKDDLLSELFDRIEDPDIRYTHVWQTGDLLMWDNRFIQHARTDFPTTERRLLRRVGLLGDKPY
ncbi:MAG: TauD/TfdA dioxygenase family protein [Alphaproteobacteria bacterium]